MKRLLLLLMAALVVLPTTRVEAQYGGSSAFLADPSVIEPGQTLNLLGTGCAAGSTVSFRIVETDTPLGSTIASSDSDGTFFYGPVTLPVDLPPGIYHIEARCSDGKGGERVTVTTVEVLPAQLSAPRKRAPGSLSVTGSNLTTTLTRVGAVLLASGGVLLLAMRRRSDDEDASAPAPLG